MSAPPAVREAYREALLELALRDPRVWCCDTDMGGLETSFGRRLPEQYLDLGIAEANLMTVAAALAARGHVPFVNTMASFAVLRAGEQVKIDIAYNALPVHIAATHAGLSGGHFGPTHQSLEDIAIMRALPNMTVVVPSDAAAGAAAVAQLAALGGPSYLRMGRKATPPVHAEGTRFEIGPALCLRPGDDVALLACGPHPVLAALEAHDRLAHWGIGARVVEVATLKPLDVEAIVAAARQTRGLVTVEEHSVVGGLGSAVAEVLAEHAPARLTRIGMPDVFCDRVGDQEYLLEHYGITGLAVARAALALAGSHPAGATTGPAERSERTERIERSGRPARIERPERQQEGSPMPETEPVWATKTILDLFAEQVAARPEQEAVRARHRRLTFAELDRESNRLGRALLDRGVGPGDVVGVILDRDLETAVALLAVLKAGAAYVAVQPDEPPVRRTTMLERAGVSVVLTQAHLAPSLAGSSVEAVLVTDGRGDGEELPPVAAGPESLAYISFTSGSTGEPKGVSVPQRGVVRLVRADFADLGPDQVFLHLAPLAFDASTLEVWAPLLNGGRLVVHAPGPVSVPELSRTLAEEGVTFLWLTAGLFHQFVDVDVAGLRSLRQLVAGGDVLSVPHVNRVLAACPELTLVNGYGPTENTTFTTCHTITGPVEGCVPIGRPITGTRVYVLDGAGQPVPAGQEGELYAGGAGVALGYVGRPDLTAERFPADLEDPSARMYRTGDLARVNADGEVEFLGRADTQVKLRGYRIEPGEIETVIASLPTVAQAVVLARKDPVGGRSQLDAYVVPTTAGTDPSAEARRAAGAVLPPYMVPATVTTIAEMPLTGNGKVDRAALPAPVAPERPTDEEYVVPATDLERTLAAIWEEVIGLEAVGVNDDFFEIGGNSLLAADVIARVSAALSLRVAARTVFENASVAELAAVLEEQLAETEQEAVA